mmetsp:Transcript_17496/g.31590  ORF Transcript_17496/g.31590 Transcript_17496/m.31590 type:complete len:268 (-) Transcript_17496:2324-3127(-)
MQRVPRFKKPLPELKTDAPSLPSGFLIDVLKQEQLLRVSHSSDVINKLTQLYSLAIEHYSSISDSKYHDYTKKLQALLIKPEVQHSISNPQLKPSSTPKGSYKPDLLLSPRGAVAQSTKDDRFAEKFLTLQLHRGSKHKNSIKESIQLQRESLEKRLKERIERRATGADSGCTAKTQPKRYIDAEEYERLLEQTLEQHLMEKHQRLMYIKSTYSEQISALQSFPPSQQIQNVIIEMQGHMADELRTEEAKLEQKKTQQIAALKLLRK